MLKTVCLFLISTLLIITPSEAQRIDPRTVYKSVICNDLMSARRMGERWRLMQESGWIEQAAIEIVEQHCFYLPEGNARVMPAYFLDSWSHGTHSLMITQSYFVHEGRRVYFYEFTLGNST
jgi:hypothetical protein